MERKIKLDPENYHKMSEPFESQDLATDALENFYNDVEDARRKYKIPDILVVTKGSTKYADGHIGQWIQHTQYGNQLEGEVMAAFVLGQMQAERRENVNKLLAGKTK